MNTNLPDAKPDIPELQQFRKLDYAPEKIVTDANLQALSQARMQQIMAEPFAEPKAHKQFTGIRRAAIATLTTLAVGLGGATAATAIGIANPVGDWVNDVFGNPVPESMDARNNDPNRGPVSVIKTVDTDYYHCTFVWHVDRPGDFDSRFEVTEGPGFSSNPEIPALGWVSVAPRDDVEPPTAEESEMLIDAAQILSEIDFADLPGTFIPPQATRPPAITANTRDGNELEVTVGIWSTPQLREFNNGGNLIDPANAEFHNALEAEFNNRLSAAGINPENVTLNWTMECIGN